MSTGREHALHEKSYAFFRALLQRPVLLLTIFVTVVIVGLIAYARIPVQMMPDGLTSPGLQLFISTPGASAQENEEQVARVLEEELRTLPRIEQIDSTARAENVTIFVEFKSDTDMNFAKAEVRDRIERARPKLPSTVRDIGVWSWSQSNMPVMFFALLHPGDSKRTDFLVDEVIKRRLEAVDGVGRLEIWGSLADSMRILLDEEKVKATRLDIGKLIRRLSADNFAEPLGEVEDGGRRILLRADMRFNSPQEIEDYPIGGGLTIKDVGRVEDVKSVRERLFRIDGRYAYYGEVQKDGQANTVETARRLEVAIRELEKDPALGGQFEFLILFNQGAFIENSMHALTGTAWEGGSFAILILFLFLWRVRLTLLVAISIPISALITIAVLYFSGGTFNVLTMTGITLALGMLVDNSIVVAENIARLRKLGRSPFEACVEGTGEVGLPVLLSTLTTVVVFLPLIFMSENPRLRIMFGELGLPLCISLVASLLTALVFLPVQVRSVLGPRAPFVENWARRLAPIASFPARTLAWTVRSLAGPKHALLRGLFALERILLRVLTPLRHVLAVGALAVAALVGLGYVGAFEAAQRAEPFELGPGLDTTALSMGLVSAAVTGILLAALCVFGLPRWRARVAVAPVRKRAARFAGNSIVEFLIDANRALATWSMRNRLASSGLAFVAVLSIMIPVRSMKVAAFGQSGETSRINFWVELEENFTLPQAETEMIRYEDFLATKKSEYGYDRIGNRFGQTGGRVSLFWKTPPPAAQLDKVRKDLTRTLPRLAGHKLQFLDEDGGDRDSRSVVTFRLKGPDSEELNRLGAEAVRILETVPGLADLRSPLGEAPPVVRVGFQSDVAQRLNVSARNALDNISWALRGFQLPSYQEPGREIPLLIEYDSSEAAGLATLRDLEVFNGESSVPLSSIAELSFDRASRTIHRNNGEASFMIQARVESPSMQKELADRGRLALGVLDYPRGYSLADEDLASWRQDREMNDIWMALALSIVLVFLLMGILFESFLLPVSVLFTIPFAIVGSYWTLFLTGTAMDSIAWIGVIILVGVVVNNGIVLIDCIHGLRGTGMERTAAVIEGCGQRVRPILMTALTSITGLLPMAMSEPQGAAIDYRALATCVAGGLAMSTVFTLWVVPLAYTLIDDASRAASASFLWGIRPRRTPSVPNPSAS
ncbi:MAG: efflux RND transporter permease subunit [Planctomycetes bacterium]|nr:efflux RND transporter permease subunit [Planctomycetota bacterium]